MIDRTFLNLSSQLAEPFCFVWHQVRFRLMAPLVVQKFENCTTIIKELAMRTSIGLNTALGTYLTYERPVPVLSTLLALGIANKALRAMGFAIQKGGYTHVHGIAPEKSLNPHNIKIMTWNICGVGGGMSLDHGGVIDWRSRLNAIVDQIKKEDPDVLLLQEVYDTALAEKLIRQLTPNYAHFFLHLGPNVWGSVGGCMIMTKCAIHHFSHTSFTNNAWTLNRGFADVELKATPQDLLPCLRILGTHLIHGNKTGRQEQIAQILRHLAHQTIKIPTLLAGDLNIGRDQEEGKILSKYLHHGYQDAIPTCTNRLAAQWNLEEKTLQDETIDYISLFKQASQNIKLGECHLVKAFDSSFNTKTALSDHHGLSLIIKLLNPSQHTAY